MNKQSTRMNRKEAAEYLGVSAGTLAVWTSTGKVRVPHIKIGRRTVYDSADLDHFMEQNKVNGDKTK